MTTDELFGAVAELFASAVSADGCLVYRIESNGEVVVVAGYPISPEGPDVLRLPGGFGVTGRVAADGIPAVLIDDSPRNPVHRALLGLHEDQLVSRLCVPARTPDGDTVAVIAAHSVGHRDFSPGEIELAQRTADLVGLRIRLEQASAALAGFEQEWEGLVAATVTVQEAERRRVAGDLHDGVTQAIASMSFRLSAADVALAGGDHGYAAEQLRAARELAEVAFAETRSAISGLHSPVVDDLGLAAGLVSLARATPHVRVEVDAPDIDLPAHIEAALYRIAQEAIQNVVKHAQASRALIRLARHHHHVVLQITDDGRGFDAPGPMSNLPRGHGSAPQYGLSGMYERVQLLGGQLSVTSLPDAGTLVEVVVPQPPL